MFSQLKREWKVGDELFQDQWNTEVAFHNSAPTNCGNYGVKFYIDDGQELVTNDTLFTVDLAN